MGFTRYGKKLPELEELGADELFERLADYLLHSGFADGWQESDLTLEELRRAVLRALLSQPIVPLEELERLLEEGDDPRERALATLADRLVRRLLEEGYLTLPERDPAQALEELPGEARFEITDKGLDFLGLKALRETLSRTGRTGFGRHPTNRLATGIESSEGVKPYEFGDTLNLDPAATLLEAVRRGGLAFPIDLLEPDLRVRTAELRVSAATVLLLDCSHSMVLYGEDRFTPAKRVALGLAHLTRTQFPGDELSLVLFHDAAEEVPLRRLPRVQVGPFHTNTAAGLELARRLLARSRRDLKSIVMITDGKPSALTLPDGRVYKNSFGLDPLIVGATLEQVSACRRSGIVIHTFMLARDRALVGFVKQVTEICRGRAYFTTPMTLGRYVTMDFLARKVETIH